jgi:hypothetical protein
VTDKSLFAGPIWKRHSDPPLLWITVFISSIALHLLVFWFLRSSDKFKPWIPYSNEAEIAVDLIDILPQVKSQIQLTATTTVTQKRLSSTQKPVIASLPNTAPTTTEKPEDDVINSEFNDQPVNSTPTATETPTPTETQIPLGELSWNRRQEVSLGKGTILPKLPDAWSPDSSTPEESPTSTTEDSINAKAGGVLASVNPILKDEVNRLIQEKKLRVDGLPDVLAQYRGSRSKELEISFLPRDSGLKEANILASLVINKNGNFQQVMVINIEPTILSSEISIYEQALNEILKHESFVGAYNKDGSQPELSSLYLRIRIEPINSQ